MTARSRRGRENVPGRSSRKVIIDVGRSNTANEANIRDRDICLCYTYGRCTRLNWLNEEGSARANIGRRRQLMSFPRNLKMCGLM
jgi:hypothetical protein